MAPTIQISAADIADMKGHVMYFGSNNLADDGNG